MHSPTAAYVQLSHSCSQYFGCALIGVAVLEHAVLYSGQSVVCLVWCQLVMAAVPVHPVLVAVPSLPFPQPNVLHL